MNKEIKDKIVAYIDRNTTATMFGFIRIEFVRDAADVPQEVSDTKLKNFIKKRFDKDFIGGLDVI